MAQQSHYLIPDLAAGAVHTDEQIIHRSRFIVSMARARSPEEAHAFIESIRAQHPGANHNCFAFVAGPAGSSGRSGASDDGEPKGTAGRPMLNVLEHCGVGQIAAVVTRYFGGILLGTGGLVKAYQDLVKLGLESLPTRELVPSKICRLEFEHRFTGIMTHLVETSGVRLLSKSFESNVVFILEVPDASFEALSGAVNTRTSGRSVLRIEEQESS